MKQKISFFATLLLAAIFVHSSCSEDEHSSTGVGSVKLRLSLASISNPVESDTRSALAAPKTEKFYTTNSDGETLTELTIEELPSSSMRSVQNMATGTCVRVYLYKKTGGAGDGDYYTSGILKAGSSSDVVWVENETDYYVKAVSYNSTTADDVPGIVTDNKSTASLPDLSADKDVLYAETEITSGVAGSELDIDLTFSHKFSLVRVVADNAANTTGTITACSATLSNKYKASLALNGGALTAGSSDGVHPFTWTSPNATAVTSNSATVYTGAQTTHVLAFTSIEAGGITYTGTSVTFNKTFEPGKTYRLTVRFKGAIPVIPTGGGTYPSGTTPYVGAFWKASRTGERLIRIPVGTDEGNHGNWSAIVAWADAHWNGLSDIVLDTGGSADPGIDTETPADMNDEDNDLLYQVAGNATGVGGTVASGDTIKFRIGLKFPYAATDAYPARYAVVVVTYGNTPAKTFNLYLRQGEDPDYVWSPTETYGIDGDLRTSAVRFSPYNLTASDLGSNEYSQITVGTNNVFTAYPTQAGAFFQWANTANPGFAYHPVIPLTITSSYWSTSNASGYWNGLISTHETCPQNYPLSTGTPVNFRRPNDGSTNGNNSAGAIADSEMRQSLWEDPQSGQTGSVIGSVWGFYADGFFDRRSHTHAAYGASGGVDNTAVSITTKDAAYIGRLFYNWDKKRSLFFPASGYRYNSNGQLNETGFRGHYWSSSVPASGGRAWSLVVSPYEAYEFSGSSLRNNGFAVRCVRDEP